MKFIGLEIDTQVLRVASLEKGRSGFKICTLKTVRVAEADNVKQLYKGGRLVSGLSSKDVILRNLDLHIGKTRHVKTALMFQSEGMTHLNPLEMISIPHSIKKSVGRVEALLVSASKEGLKNHLKEFQMIGVDLDSVSFNGMALVQYIRWKAPKLVHAFIVHLGQSEWTAVLMEKNEIKKSFALGSGTEALLTALWEDRKKNLQPKEVEEVAKQIDLLQIKPNLNPNLSAKLREIRQELAKVIFSFQRGSDQQPIVFTGDINAFGSLREFLAEACKEAITEEYDENLDHEERKYAVPIGLALEEFHRPLQLLREEFFPKKNWRRAGFYALSLVFLALSLSSLLFTVGLKATLARKKEIIESVQGLVAKWDPELEQLLHKNEELALEKWISGLEDYKKEYPFILGCPRSSEVLAWLGGHPLLQEFKLEKDPFDLRALHYQLVEIPKIGSLQNRYRAKVELQFKIKSAMNARKFHEALLKGDDTVDSSGEITWEPQNDSFCTSFYLKPLKSPYVP
jgi:hypothetical protein